MKRSSNSKLGGGNRQSAPSPLVSVDRSTLRDHGGNERVERIWSRMERQLDLSSSPAPRQPRVLLAVAVAASFALGFAVSSFTSSPAPTPQSVVVTPSLDRTAGPRVFAAGTAARSYALPGGGALQLSPDSIVDTVAHDSSGLTLRLVRGSATVAGPTAPAGAGSGRLALHIGDAQVSAIAGRLRVQLKGDSANLTMLDGSAAVSSPHLDSGARRTLRTQQRATIPHPRHRGVQRPLGHPSAAHRRRRCAAAHTRLVRRRRQCAVGRGFQR